MAFPHEHILLRFNGHFGTSSSQVDHWSAGIRFGLPTSAPAYDAGKLQTFVNQAQVLAQSFHTGTSMFTGTNCYLDFVTGAQIGVLGKYVPSAQLTALSPVTPTAGVAPPVLPWNSALVISLRTSIPRGRGSNGRVYWPAVGAPVDATTGRVSALAMDGRMTTAKTFFDGLNSAANAYSAGMKAIVASNVGGGLIATVTAIRADGRIDSIERRENDQASAYTSKALA